MSLRILGEGAKDSSLSRLTPRSNSADIKCWNVTRGAACEPSDSTSRRVSADDSSSLSILVDQRSAAAPTFIVTYDKIAQFKLSFAAREILISPLEVSLIPPLRTNSSRSLAVRFN